MSTDYNFYCEKCWQSGGHLTTQMWGTGNFNIISTFKFVMHHALNCGAENIRLRSEADEYCGLPSTSYEAMKGIFPCSDDWTFVAERLWLNKPFKDLINEWEKQYGDA